MALSAAVDDDNILLFLLLFGHQFLVVASVLYDADYRIFLSEVQLKRCSRRIARCALANMDYSSFRALYNSRNDQSFITFTGLDYKSFQYQLTKFCHIYNRYSPNKQTNKLNDY
jgi:hypothetical protein